MDPSQQPSVSQSQRQLGYFNFILPENHQDSAPVFWDQSIMMHAENIPLIQTNFQNI